MTYTHLEHGDALDVLRSLPDGLADSVVTDPPYGLSDHRVEDVSKCLQAWLRGDEYRPKKRGFAGRGWDAWVPGPELWREALRVLKPGGHLLVFSGTRSFDLMGMALRLAGATLRDYIEWVQAQGFAQGTTIDGNRSTLKPCHEPILVARAPLDGSLAQNYAAHGTGLLCASEAGVPVPPGREKPRFPVGDYGSRGLYGASGERTADPDPSVRVAPNVVLTHAPGCQGDRCADGCPAKLLGDDRNFFFPTFRFEAKARRPTQKNLRVDGTSPSSVGNAHPTVKPVPLAEWLVTLATPPGGTVIDPFMGSGSIGVAAVRAGRSFVGIEADEESLEWARRRLLIGDE